MTETSSTESQSSPTTQPVLPGEVKNFKKPKKTSSNGRLTRNEWLAGLRSTEVRDKKQKLWMRPIFAACVYLLLVVQNVGIYLIVIKALDAGVLKDLQLIFSTLVAGTLAQSYFILRLIAARIFGEIKYDDNKSRK